MRSQYVQVHVYACVHACVRLNVYTYIYTYIYIYIYSWFLRVGVRVRACVYAGTLARTLSCARAFACCASRYARFCRMDDRPPSPRDVDRRVLDGWQNSFKTMRKPSSTAMQRIRLHCGRPAHPAPARAHIRPRVSSLCRSTVRASDRTATHACVSHIFRSGVRRERAIARLINRAFDSGRAVMSLSDRAPAGTTVPRWHVMRLTLCATRARLGARWQVLARAPERA